MTEVKLTNKEEKVVASIVSFFQGLKDCPKEQREKFLLDNAFVARNIVAFKNLEPKNAYALLSSTIIHNIIPYLVAKDGEKIDEVAERIDSKTDEMLKEVVKELQENKEEVANENK